MADDDLQQLVRERDLYLRILELAQHNDVEPMLQEALSLIVATSGAERGYLELHGPARADEPPRWWIADGFDDDELKLVRRQLSSRIIAAALATGQLIETACASEDQRFQDLQSVRNNAIRAVLCAPIGKSRPIGVLYLQGRIGPSPFTPEDQHRAAVIAEHLGPILERATATTARAETDPTVAYRGKLRSPDLVGRSAALARVLAGMCVAAPLDVTVLLVGPTGTGKTHLARTIHAAGSRHDKPFIDLNCAAIPDTLLESELFGAEKGAFTHAARKLEGKVAAAEGGTLFLDEIGELSLAAQAKLLQLLDTRRFSPLGSTKVKEADVRILAATHVDLEQAVRDGKFREDLLFRIKVLRIAVPSLAERREDIPLLARHFCARACDRYHFSPMQLSPAAIAALEQTVWPGNLRQLAHAIEAGVLWAANEQAGWIEPRHLFPERASDVEVAKETLTWQEATRRFQREFLRQVLDEEQWNVARAAKRLDLTRSYVYSLIQALDLRREVE